MPFSTIPRHVLFALSALIGVLSIQCLPSLPAFFVWIVLLVCGLLVFLKRGKYFAFGVLLCFAAWAGMQADYRMQQRIPLHLVGEEVLVELRLQGLPQQDHERSQFDALILSAERHQARLNGRILRLRWYGKAPALHAESRWRMHVKLQDMRGTLNTGSFDQEKYFLEQDIDGLGYVRDTNLAMQLERGSGINSWRARIAERMVEQIGVHRTRFIRAMSIGDTRDLTNEDWNTLRATGLGHLVAISGFHVGIVATAAAWLVYLCYLLVPLMARWVPRTHVMAVAAGLTAFAYALMAGFSIATLRTAIMIGMISLCCLSRRAQSASLSFCVALIAVLLFDPLSVLDAGFWLSFVGVACLLLSLPQTRTPWLSWSTLMLKAHWIAFVGLFPFVLFFFSQNTWLSPLVNMLAVPVVSLLLVPLSLLSLLALILSPDLAEPLLLFISNCFERGMQWLSVMQQWPVMQSYLPLDSVLLIAVLLTGVSLMLLPRGPGLRWLGAICFLPVIFPMHNLPASGQLKITAFDVGRNQAVLLQTQKHTLLYFYSPSSSLIRSNPGELVSLLRLQSVNRLDVVVGNTYDADSVEMLRQYFPDLRWIGPYANDGRSACYQLKRIVWDDVTVDFLHPPEFFPDRKTDSACVMRAHAGNQSALITAGISKGLQQRLSNRYVDQLKSSIWVTNERNLARSTASEFLQAVRPEQIWFSQRAREPAPEDASIATYSVRESGQLQALIGQQSPLETLARRQISARYWRSR